MTHEYVCAPLPADASIPSPLTQSNISWSQCFFAIRYFYSTVLYCICCSYPFFYPCLATASIPLSICVPLYPCQCVLIPLIYTIPNTNKFHVWSYLSHPFFSMIPFQFPQIIPNTRDPWSRLWHVLRWRWFHHDAHGLQKELYKSPGEGARWLFFVSNTSTIWWFLSRKYPRKKGFGRIASLQEGGSVSKMQYESNSMTRSKQCSILWYWTSDLFRNMLEVRRIKT